MEGECVSTCINIGLNVTTSVVSGHTYRNTFPRETSKVLNSGIPSAVMKHTRHHASRRRYSRHQVQWKIRTEKCREACYTAGRRTVLETPSPMEYPIREVPGDVLYSRLQVQWNIRSERCRETYCTRDSKSNGISDQRGAGRRTVLETPSPMEHPIREVPGDVLYSRLQVQWKIRSHRYCQNLHCQCQRILDAACNC